MTINLKNLRLIARMDIKGDKLIKGVQMEGLRVIGDPCVYSKKYYLQGADELILMDSVASLYGRNQLGELISKIVKDVFIPITVGGGIRSMEDALKAFEYGADKVAINTAAISNPKLINDLASRFGSQSIVISIEAKKISQNRWEAYTDCGREKSGLDVIEWAKRASDLGAGEVLITSVDRDGTYKGFDAEILSLLSQNISIPIIASGGFGKLDDIIKAVNSNANALAIASALHYEKLQLSEIRNYALFNNVGVREFE